MMPHLPNELITQIIHHVLDDAYPDFLRNIPPPSASWLKDHLKNYDNVEDATAGWYDNYWDIAINHDLFACLTPGFPDHGNDHGYGPRYHEGATALTRAAKALAAVSTNWLLLTRAVYDRKLSDIDMTQRELRKTAWWFADDWQEVSRAWWFEWRTLRTCECNLAHVALSISQREKAVLLEPIRPKKTMRLILQRHREEVKRKYESLWRANQRLRREIEELKRKHDAEREANWEREESLKKENAALRERLRKAEAELKSHRKTRKVA